MLAWLVAVDVAYPVGRQVYLAILLIRELELPTILISDFATSSKEIFLY